MPVHGAYLGLMAGVAHSESALLCVRLSQRQPESVHLHVNVGLVLRTLLWGNNVMK